MAGNSDQWAALDSQNERLIDMSMPLGTKELAEVQAEKHTSTGHTTIDNDATWTQIQFLARVGLPQSTT